jgi:ATP-dependent RNA helicase RhlE
MPRDHAPRNFSQRTDPDRVRSDVAAGQPDPMRTSVDLMAGRGGNRRTHGGGGRGYGGGGGAGGYGGGGNRGGNRSNRGGY